MIMSSKDTLYNGRKGIGFENPSYFKKSKDLRPSLYYEKVIGLGYTPMFLTHSDEALEIEKFKRARENKIEFAYDYGNLNASYQTSSLKPYVPTVILENIIIDLEDEFVNLLEKEKANLETIESLKSKGFESSENAISEMENQRENDCQVVEKECDQVENSKTLLVVLEDLNRSVVDLFMYRKDLLSCNISHLEETTSAYVCNDAINVSYNSRLCDAFDENNLFIFDDESVRISLVSKIPFRKKPRDSLNVRSKRCSKHMTGNRGLLTNFVEKFLGTVRFGNNDFMVIAGYGDVVIGSMMIKKFTICRCYPLNDYEDVGKLKEKGIGVFVGYSKESASFRIYNKRTRKIHESVNVNFGEILELASKQFSLELGLSNLNETRKSSNPSVSQVSETAMKDLEDLFQKFYDEYFDASKIMKSSTTNVETSNVEIPSHEEEIFHESSEPFQEESSSSSLNDDVQQSLEEVILPQTNTQSISNNMIPNVEVSTFLIF
nr:integrase, catalytic region, zinc finger, CCHC-type, peptidase aspartic, catalytic [Tanacetum cinerariifolium]